MDHRYYRIIKENCSAWLNRFLKGTMNHFSCVLPDKMGFLPQGLLRIFFRGIRFSPDQEKLLKNLPDDAILIYVNKYKNPFEWLFCYSRFTQQNLRPPVVGVEYQARIWQPVIQMCRIIVANIYHVLHHFRTPDIYSTGFFQEKLVSGSAAWLSLADDKGFYRRFVKEKDRSHPACHSGSAFNRPAGHHRACADVFTATCRTNPTRAFWIFFLERKITPDFFEDIWRCSENRANFFWRYPSRSS